MLCLTRKVGEKILFPELGIEIVVRSVRSLNAVSIGIEAPREIKISRPGREPKTEVTSVNVPS